MTSLTEELVTLDDLAELYRCSRRHVRDVIVKTPGFPEMAPGATTYKPRWVAAEVKAFLRRKSQTPPPSARARHTATARQPD